MTVDDRALYQTILVLQAPWEVECVELRTDPPEVDGWAGAEAGVSFACSTCGQASPIYHHVERRWRHFNHVPVLDVVVRAHVSAPVRDPRGPHHFGPLGGSRLPVYPA